MKEKPTVPEDLTREERVKLKAWCESRYPQLVGRLRELVDECLAHHGAKGNPHGYKDWYRACQKWIAKDVRMTRDRYETEHPQERGPRMASEVGGELVPLGDVMQFVRREKR